MRISFLGAAGEVTGSCYLIETTGARFLVDCGLFQGGRDAEQKNRTAFSFHFAPKALDFVVLTHAHLDHSGLLPRLYALGFRGQVFATEATCDLLAVLLPDSAHIQEKEAEWQNRHRHARQGTRGSDVAPLYTVNQARECLRQLRPCAYDESCSPALDISFEFRDAGHILGSAIVEIWIGERRRKPLKLVFSGDLGQPQRLVLEDPTPIAEADVVIVESTYGNRRHKGLKETETELCSVLVDTLQHKQGNVIMPAFAVGRTQEVLFLLSDLVRRNRLPPLTIYVDSSMATAATELTLRHLELLDKETRALIAWQRQNRNRFRLRFVETVEESMALNDIASGAIIIAASGMCDAGRVKHHLRHNLSRPQCAVVITGFQAAGTLGRRLVDGARRVRIFGEEVPVRAAIHTLGGLSAHADRQALLDWLKGYISPPVRTFVVHGEFETANEFATAVRDQGWRNVVVPARGEQVDLSRE